MGHREVRPVPLDWEHPTEGTTSDGKPRYRPLFSRADLRFRLEWNADNSDSEDAQEPVDLADYMPPIPEGTPLGYQLYETTTEGTPASPVFATLEELAAWCEDGATVFAGFKWTREQWLASFQAGSLDTDSLLAIGPDGMGPLGGA